MKECIVTFNLLTVHIFIAVFLYARCTEAVSHLRWFTAGESHGPELVAWMEGIPAGLLLTEDDVNIDLARRQRGYGRGGRMKIEIDRVSIVAGVRGAETLGSPIAMVIQNTDFKNWQGRMGPHAFDVAPDPVIRPRPGHADLAGGLKYNRHDLRDILERASARETAARVAVGAVCRKLLAEFQISVHAHVISIGNINCPPVDDFNDSFWENVKSSEMLCANLEVEEKMKEAIHAASHAGDTLGGVFEVVAMGCPIGLGSHVQWDRKLDGRLAQALMSIQAIKGVEIGLGFMAASLPGSKVHDPIHYDAISSTFTRPSNGAGGLEGGITNGMPLVCRAAMKPIATLKRALESVNIQTKEPYPAAFERSDICAVPAAAIVGEAMVAIVLANALLEKFGSDSMSELRCNYKSYTEQLYHY